MRVCEFLREGGRRVIGWRAFKNDGSALQLSPQRVPASQEVEARLPHGAVSI